jgi:predicted lipoprotein with Yx(FWY)xxD motif
MPKATIHPCVAGGPNRKEAMSSSRSAGASGAGQVRRRRRAPLAAAAVLAGATMLLTSLALAANVAPTLSSASNAKLHKTIAVDAHGRTVYTLSGETSHHLLCKSRACFEAWPPVTVRSRSVKLEARGVPGHLAVLRRSNGTLQVTLRGIPLYRFSGDGAKGQANGEGIKAFGGTWHAVQAKGSQTAPPTTSPSSPTTTTTPSPPPPSY